MNTQAKPAKKTDPFPFPMVEPENYGSEFYKNHYKRGLFLACFFLILNFAMLGLTFWYQTQERKADVYVATLEGKLFRIEEYKLPQKPKLEDNPAPKTTIEAPAS